MDNSLQKLVSTSLTKVGAVTTTDSAVSDPIEWIERYFYVPELSGPIQLQPYQKAVLREAYRTDERGLYVYSVVCWSDIKKSIKSTVAAAVVLERARKLRYGSVKIVANDLKQADSRVSYYARRAIQLNKEHFKGWRVKPSGYLITTPGQTRIESIPVDPGGEAGGNDDFVTYTELHAAKDEAALRMWTETTLSPTKFGKSQRWVETYAGYSGEAPILEQLYAAGHDEGRRLDLSYTDENGIYWDLSDLEIYANDAARMLVLWNTLPRCPWQTPEYYAQETAQLTPNEFRRVHRNQWVSSSAVFVQGEWWDACQEEIPEILADEPLIVGIDAAVSGDCFAVVGVSRRDDKLLVRLCKVWKPPKGGKIDFAEPEAYLRELAAEYNVLEFAYDPYQLHDMATRLSVEYVGWFKPFQQGAERMKADKLLYDSIVRRAIAHPAIAVLSEHVKNANVDEGTRSTERMRIVKRAEHLKIDACVALSMANFEARRLDIG